MLASADGSVIVGRDYDQSNYTDLVPLLVYDTAEKKLICKIIRDEGQIVFSPFMTRLSDDGRFLVTPKHVLY